MPLNCKVTVMSDPVQSRSAAAWELTPAAWTPSLGSMLRVGARAIPVRDIRGFIGSADHDKDKKPAFAVMGIFGLVAVIFLLGVIDIGWRQRFLVGAIMFGLIAISALHDIAWQTLAGLYRVEILTANGESLSFTTVDAKEQAALLTVLEQVVARRHAANDDVASETLVPSLRPAARARQINA
jgi:Family of unknown function (DUF6232)